MKLKTKLPRAVFPRCQHIDMVQVLRSPVGPTPSAGCRILCCCLCGTSFIGMKNLRLKESCGVWCDQTAADLRQRVTESEAVRRSHDVTE